MSNSNFSSSLEFIIHLLSGGLSGVLSKSIIAPFERTKIIL